MYVRQRASSFITQALVFRFPGSLPLIQVQSVSLHHLDHYHLSRFSPTMQKNEDTTMKTRTQHKPDSAPLLSTRGQSPIPCQLEADGCLNKLSLFHPARHGLFGDTRVPLKTSSDLRPDWPCRQQSARLWLCIFRASGFRASKADVPPRFSPPTFFTLFCESWSKTPNPSRSFEPRRAARARECSDA